MPRSKSIRVKTAIPVASSQRRVYLFAALYAAVLVAGVMVAGYVEYVHFSDSMERRLEERLEAHAKSVAREIDASGYDRVYEDDVWFDWYRNILVDEGNAIGVPRIVVFNDKYEVAIDTFDVTNRGGVDYAVRVDTADIERAFQRGPGNAVSSPLYAIAGETPDSTRLAKTSYTVVNRDEIDPEEVPNPPRYIVGVELPVNYATQLQELTLIIILVVVATSVFVISTTILAVRSFVRLQHRFEEQRRRAEHADFSSGIAHELKNPLAAMLTGIQMIERRVPPKDRKAFNRLERQIRAMDRIVKAFLAFARGAQRTPERTTVGAIVAEVQKQLTPAQTHCLHVQEKVSKLELVVDQTALVQAISNLVKNAAQAALTNAEHGEVAVTNEDEEDLGSNDSRIFRPGDPRVDMTFEQRGRQLLIRVRDNGGGIPDQILARLFQPFVSGSHEGTGLGLAISRRLIEDIGGEITLISSNQRGTVFQISVPIQG